MQTTKLRGFLFAAVAVTALCGFGPCSRGSRSSAPSSGSAGSGNPERRVTAAEAKAAVADAMAEYKKPTRDCKHVIKGLVVGLPEVVTADDEPGFYALADCARVEKRWSLMKEATVRLIRGDANFAHPAMLPRAEIGMGDYDKANTDLDRLLAQHPKDPELVFTKGLAQCKEMKWPECKKGMSDAIALAHATKGMPDAKAFEGNADVLLADAEMHLGSLDQAQRHIDAADKLGADPDTVSGIRKDLVPARASKVVIDEFHQPEIPLGIYHLYGKAKEAGVVAALYLDNISPKDRQFRVEAEVLGLSERLSSNVTVLKGKTELVQMVPALKSSFNVSAQRSDMPTQLKVKVFALDPGGEKVVYDESQQVKVLPRDSLLLAVRVDEDAVRPVDAYVGAWVTPNARAVDAFLKDAKKRAPQESFAGTQMATLPQVEAIYKELHERGVSYVMDPEAASDSGFAQRTRLPSDVIASNNAQCLEGAILFATLMDAIGLDPMIVRIPGHAFVGWHAAHDPVPDGTSFYVETTMVHTAKFEDAVKYAKEEVDQQKRLSHFDHGLARFIEIRALRAKGITPQPWE